MADSLRESLFLKACRREPTSRTPVWLMRQAGRYMKEYRELRAKVSFLELCHNSDLCAQITIDAAHRLGVDAAIIFSDLLLLVEPMGFDLSYGKDQGPVIANPFRGAESLAKMKPVEPEISMGFVMEAIKKTRHDLKPHLPLIGFAGAPFTMAFYLVEGVGKRGFDKTKQLMTEDEPLWHSFLEKISEATSEYLKAQIQAGVQAVQIFDSWVGVLSPEQYRRFVLPHTRNLIQSLGDQVPVISFGTQTAPLLHVMKEVGGTVMGVDWRINLDKAWEIIGPDFAIMGNLDPTVLLSTQSEIEKETRRILSSVDHRSGHIFNLGHGVLPNTPFENVMFLVDCVKRLSELKNESSFPRKRESRIFGSPIKAFGDDALL